MIHPDQSGFSKRRSTLTCLLKTTGDWYNGWIDGGLSFHRSYKSIWHCYHDLLCKQLEHYNVQQRALSWFQSYLCNRKQYYKVGAAHSIIGKVEIGVPQGSYFGPLLFLIYNITMISQMLYSAQLCPCVLMGYLCLKLKDIFLRLMGLLTEI